MKWLVLATAAVLLLAGCGGQGNQDPREGRVITHKSNCITGGCYTDWKVCVGPDLWVRVYGLDNQRLRNSPECKP